MGEKTHVIIKEFTEFPDPMGIMIVQWNFIFYVVSNKANLMVSRNWVFTLNNPEGLLPFIESDMRYLVYQEEVGDNGTYHLQVFKEND